MAGLAATPQDSSTWTAANAISQAGPTPSTVTVTGTYTVTATVTNAYSQPVSGDVIALIVNGVTEATVATNSSGIAAFNSIPAPDMVGIYTVYLNDTSVSTNVSSLGTTLTAMPANFENPIYSVKAGSADLSFTSDLVYSEPDDQEEFGGNLYSVTHAVSTAGVVNAAPEDVYQTERYSNYDFFYTFGAVVPGEQYLVRLHFSENY